VGTSEIRRLKARLIAINTEKLKENAK